MATLPNSNLSNGQTNVTLYPDTGMAGLKFDLVNDMVGTISYNQSDVTSPGVAIHRLPAGDGCLPSVAGGTFAGIFIRDALNDHAPSPFYMPPYLQTNPSASVLSLLERGRAWAQVTTGGTCTNGGPAKYGPDGTFSDAGVNTALHAVFRSAATVLTDGTAIVLVELHSPLAA